MSDAFDNLFATQIDNNPFKVMVSVDNASHTVPPGPFPLSYLRTICRASEGPMFKDGLATTDETVVRLYGGETFLTQSHLDALRISKASEARSFYLSKDKGKASRR